VKKVNLDLEHAGGKDKVIEQYKNLLK